MEGRDVSVKNVTGSLQEVFKLVWIGGIIQSLPKEGVSYIHSLQVCTVLYAYITLAKTHMFPRIRKALES